MAPLHTCPAIRQRARRQQQQRWLWREHLATSLLPLLLLAPLLLGILVPQKPLFTARAQPSASNPPPPVSPSATASPPSNASAANNSSSTCTRSGAFAGTAYNHTFCQQLADGVSLAWSLTNNSISAVFVSTLEQAYGWVGFGWSPDCRMVGSSVIIGWGNSEETSLTAVAPWYLEQTGGQNAYQPPLSTFIMTQDPAIEVRDNGETMALRFAVLVKESLNSSSSSSSSGSGASVSSISVNGSQCVLFANGPKLTNGDWDAQPKVKLSGHQKDNAQVMKLHFRKDSVDTYNASSPFPKPPLVIGLLLLVVITFVFPGLPSAQA